MALVAYDNSDSSEFEDEDNEGATASVVILNKKEEELLISKPEPVDNVELNSQSLFNLLPQPSNKKPAVLEEDDEFLHKKETDIPIVKPKAKITVPSLSDFRDVEDTAPAVKPKKVNGKKSGLLSILPQPRNAVLSTTKSLIPHILTQKPKPNPTVKKKVPLPPIKKDKPTLAIDYSDDSDDEVQNDFFSINKPVELPEDMPLDIDEKVISKKEEGIPAPKQPRDIQSYFKQDTAETVQPEYSESSSYDYQHEASSGYENGYAAQGSSNDALDEEAIMKLCGARGKRKREDIQIVDVNQSEVLADAREWLAKGLTDDTSKRVSSSKRKGNEPTSQQKRKHQITYLAHQAKANEVELQNQWANNRQSKRQTQSKYGF
ncbi:proline-rich protein PRCC isoform X2 [Leguminivora glycinivorella]|uniref:proline-rich protein PRCC isoform X2 n=1 Tax=Leguminivora glycinivorella TaxID=1035111 RepID=UPI00200E5627|nr:proline-rich protein PRCC isoform X2 [Leguminivora glycinivorella]